MFSSAHPHAELQSIQAIQSSDALAIDEPPPHVAKTQIRMQPTEAAHEPNHECAERRLIFWRGCVDTTRLDQTALSDRQARRQLT